jgi:putative DNA primase/helicase
MDVAVDRTKIAPIPEFLHGLIAVDPVGGTMALPSNRPALTSYVQAALSEEIDSLRTTKPGSRNHALNRAAFSLGQLVGGGALPRSEVEHELHAASVSNGLVRDDGEESVRATIRSGLDAGARNPRQPPAQRETGKQASARPLIKISTEIRDVVDAALEALAENAAGQIFVKAGILVRVIREGKKVEGYKRVPDAPLISPLPEPRLLELMSASAGWLKFTPAGWEPALPPKWAVQVLAARGRWIFPFIETVTEVPTLRPDGSVIQRPGYDGATGTLYVPNAPFADVPEAPTREDATKAVAELFEPFVDFPFKTLADASVLLAAILAILARSAIPGPTPLIVIRKNAPGTGGSLAADAISVIATGRTAPRMTLTPDVREMRKLILTIAIEGTQIVLFDNLEGTIGSSVLAAAITSESWADRLLGFSKVVRAPLRPTWIATGNGLAFNRDLGRRVVLCDMHTDLEHPEDRMDFKHPDLISYVSQARTRLVGAALTILRAYCLAGRPAHDGPKKGGFVAWDDLVRGALIWAGAEDPMATTKRLRAEADTDLDGLRSALVAWRAAFPEPVTAARAVEYAREKDHELLDAFARMCDCPTDKLDSRRLGYSLRHYRDRVVGGLRFTRPDSDPDKTSLWTVEQL